MVSPDLYCNLKGYGAVRLSCVDQLFFIRDDDNVCILPTRRGPCNRASTIIASGRRSLTSWCNASGVVSGLGCSQNSFSLLTQNRECLRGGRAVVNYVDKGHRHSCRVIVLEDVSANRDPSCASLDRVGDHL